MRKLLKYTVATAIELDLIDLAVQAVDGTKIAANAAGDRTYDAASLQRLLNRTEAAISELEAQNEGGDDSPPPRLPEALQTAKKLHQRVKDAMNHLTQQEKMKRVNLTDEDAQLMKGRSGIITGYNAQTMVSPLNPEKAKWKGTLITAVEVVNNASDYGQLAPMLEKAEEITGQRVPITLADGGYNTAASLEAGLRRGQTLVMAQRNHREEQNPYFKDNFIFDSETDSYICPQKKRLPFRGIGQAKLLGSGPFRLYRASRTDCRTCEAFGTCTKDKHTGRALWISASDELLRKHRQWMDTDEARTLYARRKEMSEPTFGILKEQMNARRFLLRGLTNVRAEFNLRTLWRIWSQLGISCNKVNVVSGDNQSANVQIHRLFGTNHGTISVLIFA
jgi:transposase